MKQSNQMGRFIALGVGLVRPWVWLPVIFRWA